MADNKTSDLCPALRALVPKFIENCAFDGVTVKILVTWRDATAQNAAKAAGLSNAAAGSSPHNCLDVQGNPASKAFDFGVFNNGVYLTNGSDPRYAQAGAVAVALGLAWGGDWHHPDYDHVELMNWRTANG